MTVHSRLKAALGDMPPTVNPTAYNQVFGVLRVLELALEDPGAVLQLGDK